MLGLLIEGTNREQAKIALASLVAFAVSSKERTVFLRLISRYLMSGSSA